MLNLLLSCCLAFASERSPILETYLMLQNGIRPILSGAALNEAKGLLRTNIENMRASLTSMNWPTSSNCQRYTHALSDALHQVDRAIFSMGDKADFDEMSDDQMMYRLRARLLIASVFGLHALFKDRREGGFGSLDPALKISCSLPERENLQREFDEFVQNLSRFSRAALGNPGVLGFDKINTRLLPLVSANEQAAQRLSLKLFAGTVLASIVFWEVAPAAVGIVASKLGMSALLAASPTLVFVVRSATLGAEGLGYHYLDKAMIPDDGLHSQDAIPSWDEQLSEVERLSNSPLYSPSLYLAYLSQIKSQLAVLYGPWLSGHAKELAAQASDEFHFKEVIALNRENQILGGGSIEDAIQRLPQAIQKLYGYRIKCASGMIEGLSPASCLTGLRTFARAIYRDEIGKLKVPPALFHIEITSGASPATYFTDTKATIDVPYTLTVPQVAAVVQATLVGEQMSDLVFKSSQFADAFESFEANIPKPVKFDRSLGWSEKWHALRRLVSLAKEDLSLFEGVEDEILITRWGSGIRESRLGLQMTLSIDDGDPTWRDCLKFNKNAGVSAIAERVRDLQSRVTEKMSDIEKQWHVTVGCSPERGLSLQECYRGLASLQGLLEVNASIPFLNRSILIVSPEEVSGCCQIVENSQTLALRYTFQYPEALQFAVKKGWVGSSNY